MGYGLIPITAASILLIHHLAATEASRLSKLLLSIVVLASLVIWKFFPQWLLAAILLQSAASIYMLVYLKVQAAGASR